MCVIYPLMVGVDNGIKSWRDGGAEQSRQSVVLFTVIAGLSALQFPP